MPISGYIAGGAHAALEEVLDRRLKEQVRQAQEKQHADSIAIQRQQIALQQRRDQAMDDERLADRQWRQQQGDIATADRTLARTPAGPTSEAAATNILKDPANVGMITRRNVINAKPIDAPSMLAGSVAPQTAGDVGPNPALGLPARQIIDASPVGARPAMAGGAMAAAPSQVGPQNFPVREPTPAEAKESFLRSEKDRVYEALSQPGLSEDQKRVIATKAMRTGVEVPEHLYGPTEAEKRKTITDAQIAAEDRSDKRWYDHEAYSLAHQKEHPEIWVSKPGESDQFVTPSRAAALAGDGWKHSTTQGSASEDERKSLGFYRQMTEAIKILDEVEGKLTSQDLYQIQSLPQEDLIGLMNRGKMTEAAKRYVRAFESFTEARLRPVSGAAIADTEFARDRRTYAKQYGETPQLNIDRRQAREGALDSLRVRSGRALEKDTVKPTRKYYNADGTPRDKP